MIDDGEWRSVSVGENGQMYGLRRADDIWEACARIGYSADMPHGDGFDCFDVSGEVKNFNAGNHEIWMVNVHNEVY